MTNLLFTFYDLDDKKIDIWCQTWSFKLSNSIWNGVPPMVNKCQFDYILVLFPEYCMSRACPDLPKSEYLHTIGKKLDPGIDILWTGIIQFLYTLLKNGTYYVIALYGRAGVCKMVSAQYLKKYLGILTKFGTQGKTKTKFEPGDFDLIFKVTEVI